MIGFQPVWLRLSQEFSLLQGAGVDTKLLHHRLGRAAVTENLGQDHLRNTDRQKHEPGFSIDRLSTLDFLRCTALSE